MKRLFVGCRVRVNFPSSDVHGRETRILAMNLPGMDFGRPYIGHEVDILVPPEFADYPGERYGFESHELEPIQDPGHQIVSWEAMKGLWTPEGIPA